MKRVLIAYHTEHGQTRQIAERLAERIRSLGGEVDLLDIVDSPKRIPWSRYRVVVFGAHVERLRL